jgi:hypothetical protein
MSAYDSIFSRYGLPAVQSAFGAAVTFTNVATSATTAVPDAILGAEADELLEFDAQGMRGRYRHRVVELPTATIAATLAKRPNTITIGGEAWTIHEQLGVEGGLARVLVIRQERVEAAGRRAVK